MVLDNSKMSRHLWAACSCWTLLISTSVFMLLTIRPFPRPVNPPLHPSEPNLEIGQNSSHPALLGGLTKVQKGFILSVERLKR